MWLNLARPMVQWSYHAPLNASVVRIRGLHARIEPLQDAIQRIGIASIMMTIAAFLRTLKFVKMYAPHLDRLVPIYQVNVADHYKVVLKFKTYKCGNECNDFNVSIHC